MFIEGLRRAKKKWRIGVSVLLGLIIVSLVLSFAYFGQTMGTSSPVADAASVLENAEAAAEAAADATKDADGDATLLGQAADAYLSLAAYQELYLEDPSDAYTEALKYATEMVAACSATPGADYYVAYNYVMEANFGLGDAEAISAAFNESLTLVGLDQSYVNTYYQYMTELGASDLMADDLAAAKIVAEKAESETEKGEAEEETESLADYIDTLLAALTVTDAAE